jgi:hypothetical protein
MSAARGGSPSAQRFDPPCARRAGSCSRRRSVARVRARAAGARGSTTRRSSACSRHGGIWLDRHPVAPGAEPLEVREGAHVAVYAFEREPEPVPLEGDGILLYRDGVVAVNKPAWLPVQGTRASQLHSLERMLAERLGCAGLRARTASIARQRRAPCSRATRSAAVSAARCRTAASRSLPRLVSPRPSGRVDVRGPLGPSVTERATASSCARQPPTRETARRSSVSSRATLRARSSSAARSPAARTSSACTVASFDRATISTARTGAGAASSAERIQLRRAALRCG